MAAVLVWTETDSVDVLESVKERKKERERIVEITWKIDQLFQNLSVKSGQSRRRSSKKKEW